LEGISESRIDSDRIAVGGGKVGKCGAKLAELRVEVVDLRLRQGRGQFCKGAFGLFVPIKCSQSDTA
jgi:hypothetical protein